MLPAGRRHSIVARAIKHARGILSAQSGRQFLSSKSFFLPQRIVRHPRQHPDHFFRSMGEEKMRTYIVTLLVSALLGAVMGGGQSVYAATNTVTSTANSGAGTLRAALASVANGDTINFSVATPAAIMLTSGELVVSNNVTILGPGLNSLG